MHNVSRLTCETFDRNSADHVFHKRYTVLRVSVFDTNSHLKILNALNK